MAAYAWSAYGNKTAQPAGSYTIRQKQSNKAGELERRKGYIMTSTRDIKIKEGDQNTIEFNKFIYGQVVREKIRITKKELEYLKSILNDEIMVDDFIYSIA